MYREPSVSLRLKWLFLADLKSSNHKGWKNIVVKLVSHACFRLKTTFLLI